MRQPILWLVGGLLSGVGFVSAFGGGLPLLVIGVAILIATGARNRRHLRGWSAAIYAFGAAVALFLSPYVFRQSRCAQNTDAGCYQAFNLAVFLMAVGLALLGLVLGVVEIRRWHRSASIR
ncbi:MAG TPA: hypothetical protein VGD57_08345 [Candidatus Dormibacteraeota bacterium]